jgi:hypothetical protein
MLTYADVCYADVCYALALVKQLQQHRPAAAAGGRGGGDEGAEAVWLKQNLFCELPEGLGGTLSSYWAKL